eukprot:TRINITY_DN20408_c0_g1_i1.p1 TRINITY_DN20408_c0_g1~~TRINITY_DN20408_c0_g1_i1.p1  ORF type:complete len:445 (+),score=67.13 TRINITY_DN20408_c0_g1_i1:78-1412(+)
MALSVILVTIPAIAAIGAFLRAGELAHLLDSPQSACICLVFVVTLAFIAGFKRGQKTHRSDWSAVVAPLGEVVQDQSAVEVKVTGNAANCGSAIRPLPDQPHLQGVLNPPTGILHSNPDEPFPFENDFASGEFLPLHRPTFDKKLDQAGNYPYSHVFNGRRNNWEMRIQIRFKETPEGPLMFGIELDEYVPLMRGAKFVMQKVVAALRWVVGDELYHSVGDDPAVVNGEVEKPLFSMPLWAFDQVIVTPVGQSPPKLTDPDLHHMGYSRDQDRVAFTKAMGDLKLEAGATYTLCFWSISTFLDNIQWQISGVLPGVTIDFNQFCGAPPVHIVLYTLKPPLSSESSETRHLDSRKNYYFQLAFWSSEHRPLPNRLKDLLGESPGLSNELGSSSPVVKEDAPINKVPELSEGWKKSAKRNVLGCCFGGMLVPLPPRKRKIAASGGA